MMRFPRWKPPIRVLMIAVAIIAVADWSYRMDDLARKYALRAKTYRRLALAYAVRSIRAHQGGGATRAQAEEFNRYRAGLEHTRDYYFKLEAKYNRAARYPWLPVEPDPLPPE